MYHSPFLLDKKYYKDEVKDRALKRNKKYRSEHLEEFKERDRKYYQTHRRVRLDYARQQYWDNVEKFKDKNSEQYLKNREKRLAYQTEYNKERKALYPEKERIRCRNKSLITRAWLREMVFHVLGHRCVKCGEHDKRVLQFDHINGDGYKESKLSIVVKFKAYLSNPELTRKTMQVLCSNCNIRKRYEYDEWSVISRNA